MSDCNRGRRQIGSTSTPRPARIRGLLVQCFGSAEELLESREQHNAACLIADTRLPGMSGLQLDAGLVAEHCDLPIIFITAHGDDKMRAKAMNNGAVDFMTKPVDDEALLVGIRAALANRLVF